MSTGQFTTADIDPPAPAAKPMGQFTAADLDDPPQMVQRVRYTAPGQGIQEFTQGGDDEAAFLKRFPQARQIPIQAGAQGRTAPSYTAVTNTPYEQAEAARDAEGTRRAAGALKTAAVAGGAMLAPELLPEGTAALPWLARAGARAVASGLGAGVGNMSGQAVSGDNPLTARSLKETGVVAGTTAAIAAPFEAASGALNAWRAARAAKALGQPTEDFTAAIPPSRSAPYTPNDYQAARPYLEGEHAASPIRSVQDIRDAADSSIEKIEDKIGGYIQANPGEFVSTNPLSDVRKALASNARGQSFADAGLKDLGDFGFDQPKTLEEADAIRRQLNQENQAVLAQNRYSVATARATDPAFAAREAAAESLRNGIYGSLDQLGFPDARALRQDEGSIIKIRNAAQSQAFSGGRQVRSSALAGPVRQTAKALTKAAITGAGAHVAGAPGAIVGSGIGEQVGSTFVPEALTRDALVERSFSAPNSAQTARPVAPPVARSPATDTAAAVATGVGAGTATSDRGLSDLQAVGR